MRRGRIRAMVLPALVLVACGGPDYSGGLERPPTEGVPTEGPGSGETLAAILHYTMQINEPGILFRDPSCPDVPVAEPGATVTCEMTVREGGGGPAGVHPAPGRGGPVGRHRRLSLRIAPRRS